MTYYSGFVAAVPTANKRTYADYATAAWPVLQSLGASRMVETWGVDVPRGEVTDFQRAVAANDDETVVFSWVAWPDRATADAAWRHMETGPASKEMPEMPFDGTRMIVGGFAPVFERGVDRAARYFQGFVLAVPRANEVRYVAMAEMGWKIFATRGALGMVENLGEDVPRGTHTDFHRATKLEDGEVPAFSWIAWPDRETCEAAATTIEADMAESGLSDMPFDGMRMMWGGFEPMFDSAEAS